MNLFQSIKLESPITYVGSNIQTIFSIFFCHFREFYHLPNGVLPCFFYVIFTCVEFYGMTWLVIVLFSSTQNLIEIALGLPIICLFLLFGISQWVRIIFFLKIYLLLLDCKSCLADCTNLSLSLSYHIILSFLLVHKFHKLDIQTNILDTLYQVILSFLVYGCPKLGIRALNLDNLSFLLNRHLDRCTFFLPNFEIKNTLVISSSSFILFHSYTN